MGLLGRQVHLIGKCTLTRGRGTGNISPINLFFNFFLFQL